MYFTLDTITIILITIICVNSGLAFISINSRKERINKIYFINILTIIGWVLTMICYRLASESTVLIFTKLLYISATLIASNFLYMTYLFPSIEYINNLKKNLIFLFNFLIIIIISFSDLIIKYIEIYPTKENIIHWGSLHFVYIFYILLYFNIAFYRFLMKTFTIQDKLQKKQIRYILVGYGTSGLISFITNLILPAFGYFELNWFGQVSTIFMVIPITYAIMKYNLFNIKLIAIQLVTFVLWVSLLIKTTTAKNSDDFLLEIGLFISTIAIGIMFIKNTLHIIKQNDQIKKLLEDIK